MATLLRRRPDAVCHPVGRPLRHRSEVVRQDPSHLHSRCGRKPSRGSVTSTRALGSPTTRAIEQPSRRTPCPRAVASGVKATGDRHPIRILRDRGSHGTARRYTALDFDFSGRDRGTPVRDLHAIARGCRAWTLGGGCGDGPRAIVLVRNPNLFCRCMSWAEETCQQSRC